MIMMMTVMMVVLMTVNDWLSIMMTQIIVSGTAALTVMMFTMSVMVLWCG